MYFFSSIVELTNYSLVLTDSMGHEDFNVIETEGGICNGAAVM